MFDDFFAKNVAIFAAIIGFCAVLIIIGAVHKNLSNNKKAAVIKAATSTEQMACCKTKSKK